MIGRGFFAAVSGEFLVLWQVPAMRGALSGAQWADYIERRRVAHRRALAGKPWRYRPGGAK